MTDPVGDATATFAETAAKSIQALEARVAELEAVVKTLAEHSRASTHGVVVAWLEKVGARIKAAVGSL